MPPLGDSANLEALWNGLRARQMHFDETALT